MLTHECVYVLICGHINTHILLLELREDARSEPGMTDSMLLINAGKAQEPTDS